MQQMHRENRGKVDSRCCRQRSFLISVAIVVHLWVLLNLYFLKQLTHKYEKNEEFQANTPEIESEQKPWLIVHIGPPKTGSTTIQCGLQKLSKLLADQDKYYFLGKHCADASTQFNNGEQDVEPFQPSYYAMGSTYNKTMRKMALFLTNPIPKVIQNLDQTMNNTY